MSMLYSYDGHYTSEVKGAPELLLAQCRHILDHGTVRPLTDQDREAIMTTNTNFATQAMRVLGFAYKEMPTLTEDSKKEAESDLTFV